MVDNKTVDGSVVALLRPRMEDVFFGPAEPARTPMAWGIAAIPAAYINRHRREDQQEKSSGIRLYPPWPSD